MGRSGVVVRALGLASALTVAVSLAPAASAQPPAPCDQWEVEYALSANLELRDTPLGQGDGVYAIGPGRAVLRFEDRDGEPGGNARLVAYQMREHFTVSSKTLVFTTTVVTDTHTQATPEGCDAIARGRMGRTTLQWSTPIAGYRTDGTLTCDGALCGKFGAPPPGRSELHIAPHPVPFHAFEFADDRKTFTMASTFVAKTDMPRQTAYLTLAGREVRRACVAAPVCR